MSYCADTNILVRWTELGTQQCEQARAAVQALHARGETIYITPQNLVEFWSVATRPLKLNGLGLTPQEADAEAAKLEAMFPLLADTPAIHGEWRRIVVAHDVRGAQVHDARIAAALLVHEVENIMTFNTDDFKRYVHLTSVHPADVPTP